MPVHNLNRTIAVSLIEQGAAGSTDLVTAPGPGLKIYVVEIVLAMTPAGTIRFTEGTGPTNLTGPIPLAASTPLVVIGDGINHVLATGTANVKLSITTATGAASGWISYFVAA